MNMISTNIKDGYIKLITDNQFTHAMTLKPNSTSAASASPAFRITSGNERFQLTSSTTSKNAKVQYWNGSFGDNILFSKLHRFHGLLDRALVGRRFNEAQNAQLRTKIIAISEGTKATGHLHCAIRVHESRLTRFNLMFPTDLTNSIGKSLWNKVAVGGTLKVDEIYNLDYWAGYIAKSLNGDSLSDRIQILV